MRAQRGGAARWRAGRSAAPAPDRSGFRHHRDRSATPDLAERTFARDPFALLVGRRHDALPSAVSLRDVAALPWVLPEAQGAFRRQVDALFIAAQTPVPANVVRCDRC
ncbi:hypothetical protein ACFS32_00735 [Novosphingobium pokkalii]|uniref:hypothetical protein n=1 Tax=Novosphingobium pokkalii TaxID=1770194 RepID=UPI003625D475